MSLEYNTEVIIRRESGPLLSEAINSDVKYLTVVVHLRSSYCNIN